mmetsp:Transcript_16890/g.43810  ORF Transcript_16890/g.43810 Transcript_16890/m.43810 type:complete len:694 (-) Transcript_16890:1034-3115(-)
MLGLAAGQGARHGCDDDNMVHWKNWVTAGSSRSNGTGGRRSCRLRESLARLACCSRRSAWRRWLLVQAWQWATRRRSNGSAGTYGGSGVGTWLARGPGRRSGRRLHGGALARRRGLIEEVVEALALLLEVVGDRGAGQGVLQQVAGELLPVQLNAGRLGRRLVDDLHLVAHVEQRLPARRLVPVVDEQLLSNGVAQCAAGEQPRGGRASGQLTQLGVALAVTLRAVHDDAVDRGGIQRGLLGAAHLQAAEGAVLRVLREAACHLARQGRQRVVLLRAARGAALFISQLQLPSDQPACKGDMRFRHDIQRLVQRAGVAERRKAALLLVAPVRGDAMLGDVVHLGGADLHLKGHAVVATHHGVQALVAILLAVADVVLEAPLHGRPQAVHLAQRGVAVGLAAHDDAHRAHVVDLVHRVPLFLHLLKQAVQVLGAAAEVLRRDASIRQSALQLVQGAGDGAAVAGDARLERGILLGALRVKGIVFQLRLERPHAQAVGKRREQLQRLTSGGGALRRPAAADGAHAVDALRQLDEHHAHVGHGEQHRTQLARGRGVHGALCGAVQLADLIHAAHTFHHLDHCAREQPMQHLRRHHGEVQHGVEQPRRDGGVVQSEVGEDARRLGRVAEKALAILPALTLVGSCGDVEGLHHDGRVKHGVLLLAGGQQANGQLGRRVQENTIRGRHVERPAGNGRRRQ